MKRFEEMSKKELANLTDEQIEVLLDYECALVGTPLLPQKPIEPQITKYDPDTTIYKIGDFKFLKSEDAAKVLEVLQASELVDYNYSTRVIKPIDDYSKPDIKTEKYFSSEYYNSILKDKKVSDTRLSEYKDAKKEYDDAAKERNNVITEFMDLISEARTEEYKKERYRQEFERYLKLSENDRSIAFNFLINAHSDINDFDDFEEFKVELVGGIK